MGKTKRIYEEFLEDCGGFESSRPSKGEPYEFFEQTKSHKAVIFESETEQRMLQEIKWRDKEWRS